MRWTIGNVSEAGWECLSESTRLLPKIYPELDFVICYNNLNKSQEKKLKKMGINTLKQTPEQIKIPHEKSKKKVSDHFWKLCPIRIRPEAHEIWIDNDIVIKDRIPELDEFLKGNVTIISQAWGRENYGSFDNMVPKTKPWTCCAGFFGIPPNFDLEEKIKKICKEPLKEFDEQGMIAYIVTNTEGWIPIQTHHLKQEGWWETVSEFKKGSHFIRLNIETNSAWEKYKILSHPFAKINKMSKWMYKQQKEIKIKI